MTVLCILMACEKFLWHGDQHWNYQHLWDELLQWHYQLFQIFLPDTYNHNYCTEWKYLICKKKIFYQLGLKYTIHGILVFTDFTDSKVLLSSNICFSNRKNSIRLSYVCTKYLEEDIFSATQTLNKLLTV